MTDALLNGYGHDPEADPRQFVAYLLGDLIVSPAAQRPVDPERVRKIAHDFDWLRFETPTVVPVEDGHARVIEGQHRVSALREIADETTVVMCAALPVPPDRPTEAAIALAILRGRRGHTALDRWKLLVVMREPHEVAAERAMADRHLRLGTSPSPTTIAAVQSVSRIIHGRRLTPSVGADLLGRTMDVIAGSFPADEEASGSRWDGRLMRAVADLLARNPNLDVARLIAVLGSHESIVWLQRAMRMSEEPVWQTIRDLVSQRYNRGMDDGRIQ